MSQTPVASNPPHSVGDQESISCWLTDWCHLWTIGLMGPLWQPWHEPRQGASFSLIRLLGLFCLILLLCVPLCSGRSAFSHRAKAISNSMWMSEEGRMNNAIKVSILPIDCLRSLGSHVNVRPGGYIKYEEPYLVGKNMNIFLFTLI